MSMPTVNDLRTPIGDVLDLAGENGVLVQRHGKTPFAVIPLDDDVIDLLIERNPQFIAECHAIRQRMQQGALHSQAEVNEMFGRKQPPPG